MADDPKWCPMVALVTARRADSFNRAVVTDANEEPQLPVATLCVRDRCQMWTGTDCGLKR